jgi:hypothetical protein
MVPPKSSSCRGRSLWSLTNRVFKMEENPAKRRKLERHGQAPISMSRSSSFGLATDELLKAVRVDERAFAGVDELLHQVKDVMEGISGHAPRLVCKSHNEWSAILYLHSLDTGGHIRAPKLQEHSNPLP